LPRACRYDFAEVEIKGQDDALLANGLLEYLAVWEPLQSFVMQMERIMAGGAQPIHNAHRHAHVGQEAHQFFLTQ
jgi:hypothetical protein